MAIEFFPFSTINTIYDLTDNGLGLGDIEKIKYHGIFDLIMIL